MSRWYILKDKIPVPVDIHEYWLWSSIDFDNNCVVEKTKIGNVEVSTVFLGLDHNYSFFSEKKGDPVLFETMVLVAS